MKIISKISSNLEGKKLFRDGWLVTLLAILFLTNTFLIIWSLTHIKPIDIDVPIRFTSLSNFDVLGKWYQLYEITAISFIVSIINGFFAALLHKKNRILSIFLLICAIMVSILAIAILLGFTAIRYGN